jgi:uncharacterized protein (DUF1684 family)
MSAGRVRDHGGLVVLAAASLVAAGGIVADGPVTGRAVAAAAAPAGAVRTAEDERRDKDAYFRDNPWSLLRAFARYDFAARAPGEPEPSVVIGSAPDAGVRLDGSGVLPRHMRLTVLSPEHENGPWRFRIERLASGAAIRIGGEDWPAAPPAAENPTPGDARVVDEETVVEAGPFALRPYVQSDVGILIEFDRRRTEGSAFVPPAWFPVDPAWVFRAPLQRYEEPEAMSLLTSLGRRKEYLRAGYFEIEPPGGAGAGGGAAVAERGAPGAVGGPAGAPRVRVYAYRATFIAQEEESLSILFTDLTSGAESYVTGRYLDLGPPRGGLYTIDFNRAYNPLCAYTHVYNCPIPPQENALPIAVRAGEKSWPGRPHH